MTHPEQENRRYDQLVDGELSPDEFRALVSSLDDEPGGWRACALAFLEAQALSEELTALRDEKATATVDAKKTATPPAQRTSVWMLSLAMAASFLLAVGLGFAAGSYWIIGPVEERGAAVAIEDKQPAPAFDSDIESESRPDDASLAVETPSPQDADDQPMGNVTLLVDGQGDDPQRVEVPIYYLEQVGSEFLASDHTALSPEIADWLRRSGHQVQRVQSYFPMQLDDGQQVVVPVEEIQITPASLPPL